MSAPDPVATPDEVALPWPPWLENMSARARINAIVQAVANCADGHLAAPLDDPRQHCTPIMAEHFLAKLVAEHAP